MQRIAVELDLDPLEVVRRNLIAAEKFPYRTAAGALYDSGDYPRAVEIAVGEGRLEELQRRREEARAEGRKYGIGFAAVVEPAMSNMGYLSTVMTAGTRPRRAEERRSVDGDGEHRSARRGHRHRRCHRAGPEPQDGAGADRRRRARPRPDDIGVILELDTAKDQWSIAAGTYSSRFASGTAVAAHIAAAQMPEKLKSIGAKQLNVLPDDVELAGGKIEAAAIPTMRCRSAGSPPPRIGRRCCFRRDGAGAQRNRHVDAARARAAWPRRPHQHLIDLGFVFDMCGVEIDPVSYHVRIDRYVTMHDAGARPQPKIADGQIHGAFAQGVAAALYEEFSYNEEGAFSVRHFRRLSGADGGRNPRGQILTFESPSPDPARRQGPRRRQLHVDARLHRQCHRRCQQYVTSSAASTGSVTYAITLTGSGFINGSTADFDGGTPFRRFRRATPLTAVIPTSDLSTVGTELVTVVTAGPGGGTSGSATSPSAPPPAQRSPLPLRPASVPAPDGRPERHRRQQRAQSQRRNGDVHRPQRYNRRRRRRRAARTSRFRRHAAVG